MNRALVVNAGSSSLKLSVLGPAYEIAATLTIDPWDGGLDHAGLRRFLGGQPGLDAVGHRVVHGGSRFTTATVIDEPVIAAIGELTTSRRCTSPAPWPGSKPRGPPCPGWPRLRWQDGTESVAFIRDHTRGSSSHLVAKFE